MYICINFGLTLRRRQAVRDLGLTLNPNAGLTRRNTYSYSCVSANGIREYLIKI